MRNPSRHPLQHDPIRNGFEETTVGRISGSLPLRLRVSAVKRFRPITLMFLGSAAGAAHVRSEGMKRGGTASSASST
jgi:hypothetical protein